MGMLNAERSGGPQTEEGQGTGLEAKKQTAPAATPEDSGTLDEQALIQRGVKLLYDERFDKLMAMFEANGIERFGDSVATAINTVITELEGGESFPPETAARVGMELFAMLIEDVVSGGGMEGIGEEQISQALGKTLNMYAKTHKDTVTPQDMQNLAAAIEAEQQDTPGAPPPRKAEPEQLGAI